ncbi:hypothetical protein ACQPYA_06140 [Micromonospora sp. CA-263727]|uniref:hypothetical protein n=1 Tax=Micromonospora sp. CA-263727 TaxID=3239967 RepID=UPI003D89D9F8
MAAGVIIAREAGDTAIDGNGARHDITSTTTLAVTPELTGPIILAASQKPVVLGTDAR